MSSGNNQKRLHGGGGHWVRCGRSGSLDRVSLRNEAVRGGGEEPELWSQEAWVPTQTLPLIDYVRTLYKFT